MQVMLYSICGVMLTTEENNSDLFSNIINIFILKKKL